MYQRFALFSVACFIGLYTTAQKLNPAPAVIAAPVNKPVYHFTTLNPKLQYVFVENKATTEHPKEGDDVMLRMIAICNNHFMYSSSQVNKGKPGAFTLSKAAFKGDIMDALVLMTPGDSIICLVDAQAMFEYTKKPLPDYVKPGDKIQYNIRLVSIKPREQIEKEQQDALAKAMQETDPKADANKQQAADDELLKNYFSRKNITPIKTASGMYYSIQQQGNGSLAIPGDHVVMNYRGTLPDGTMFDSNTDSAFKHVQPLNFVLGTGRVIKGWDEGIGYLKPGAKAFFYIPSHLAYGAQSRPGNAANPKGIPANSILIFEVELLAATHPPAAVPNLLKPAIDSVRKQDAAPVKQ